MSAENLIERILAFKLGIDDGRFLRDVDPECADALNEYWLRFGVYGSHPHKPSMDFLFESVERGINAAQGPAKPSPSDLPGVTHA